MTLFSKFSLLGALILFFSCSSKKQNIIGVYKHQNKIGTEYFEVYEDSTFYLKSNIPLMEYESSGKWYMYKNRIYLKSYDSYKNDYVIIEELEAKEGRNSILFTDENDAILPNVILNLNDNWYESNFNGEITNLNLNQNDVLKISHIHLSREFDYKVLNEFESYVVKIKVYRKNYTFIYLDDEARFNKNLVLLKSKKFKKI
ncbi:hypothetical protein [Flavobacterium orientale]|uniref:Lipoprotein n=1 Tax=Flavobacterium orientale TaxID=1756020 RepID=A0A916XYC7_9FLAO|nr:hypothetical protein [Flavobacterium orientale]GGD21313.1 hypothetical protein GCM10011343_09710 [Flavobacterium orientale]